jgi:PKD repeat protein
VNPSFVVDVPGTYAATLAVTDGTGRASEPRRVEVTVGTCTTAAPGVADVTATPAAPTVGAAVLLTADVSDADADAPCSVPQAFAYAWRLVSLPVGSRAALNAPTSTQPSFVVDVPGSYVAALVVTDGTGRASPARTVEMTVGACTTASPVVSAAAATPAAPNVGDFVQLSSAVEDGDSAEPCSVPQSFRYAWRLVALPSGSRAAINDAGARNPSFLADVAGTYVAQVVVTDQTGRASAPALVELTVAPCGGAVPAIESAAATPARPDVGQVVRLAAVVSDADAGGSCNKPQNLAYAWRLVGLPAGSRASLNDAGAESPSLTVDKPGTYAAVLVVTDQAGLRSEPKAVTVEATSCGSARPVALVTAPAAAAIGATVALTAAVTDADTQAGCSRDAALRYAWAFDSVPAGSAAALNDAGVASPSFVADRAGAYRVRLVVTDADGHTSVAATGETTVSACGGNAPVATLEASPAAPGVGTLVQLSSVVSDADTAAPCSGAESFSYAWSFVAVPAGSSAVLAQASLAAPTFVPDVAGEYALQLDVTDSTGRTTRGARLAVTVSACGAAAPVAEINASTTSPAPGAAVLLTASAVDADTLPACGASQTMTWAWSFDALPAGSAATLNQLAATSPSFVPDLPGDYVVALVATDSTGRASARATQRVTASTCGTALPVATAAASTASPSVRQAVLLTATVTDDDNLAACGAGQTVALAWSFLALPAGSVAVINALSAASPSFVPDLPGVYVVGVTPTDSSGRRGLQQTVTVTASPCGSALPSVTATASTTTPYAGQAVRVAAVGADADNDAPCSAAQSLSYAWTLTTLPAGSRAVLQAPASATPSFVADVAGAYVAQVVATDSTGRASAPATVAITADACGANAPSATIAQSPSSVGTGMAVQLVPSVTDADNDAACQALPSAPAPQTFTYQWTLLSAPVASAARLVSATARDAAFVADAPGAYVVRLVVTDSSGRAGEPVEHTVTADACGANAPVVSAATASNPTPGVGQAVSLSATLDDTDNGAACQAVLGRLQTFALAWSVVSAPAGSTAQVVRPAALAASFTPDVAGAYVLQFTATDSTGRPSAAGTVSLAANTCGANPPAVTVTGGGSTNVGGVVTFAANATDADNAAPCSAGQTMVAYRWTLVEAPAGSRASLLQGVQATSLVADVAGTYTATVVATDSTGRSSEAARASVTVRTCGGNAPVAVATGGGNVAINTDALFDGTTSSDADNLAPCSLGQALSYQWELFSVPAGSSATLKPVATVATPSLRPDRAGTYVVRLRVTDSTGLTSAVVTQSVTAN